VKEAHFEKFQPPQADGYEKARRLGNDNVAIVIDNGKTASMLSDPYDTASY
jgi:hypothetical protein